MTYTSVERRESEELGIMASELGVCQWFHYEAYGDVERAVSELRELGVRHLRTGISWADFHRPRGRAWYDWQMSQLDQFELLVSVWHTPPSIAEGACCAGPPRDVGDYAAFIRQLIELYGDKIHAVELWNEPNNRMKWDFETFDPNWKKFAQMIRLAGRAAHASGMKTVLGGMIPVDKHWLCLMRDHGALEDIDVIAIHGFPGMWWADAPNWDWHDHWHGWADKVATLAAHAEGRPVWITETGLATWDRRSWCRGRYVEQCQRLYDAARAPVPRAYWYSLIDLDPAREAIEGFHVDENEYHLGLIQYEGARKPAWQLAQALLGRLSTVPEATPAFVGRA